MDGSLYFDGLPTTRWARNIAANPFAAIHLESGEEVLILEGVVEDVVTDAASGARVVEAWEAKYGRLHPRPATEEIFRLRARAGRGWSSSSLMDGVRWRFEEA